jgi:hypothetical protein
MTNSLEGLLKEAKHHAWLASASSPASRRLPSYLPYANPENWTAGGLVELVESDSGTRLGLFQELLYRHGGRKLVPAALPKGTVCSIRSECVCGKHWLEPRVEAPAPLMPEHEILELRTRLIDLLKEWDESEG